MNKSDSNYIMKDSSEWKITPPENIKPLLAYCDYIAYSIIKPALFEDSTDVHGILDEVSTVKGDLHPKDGYLMSTSKIINVTDVHGKSYKITIEEVV